MKGRIVRPKVYLEGLEIPCYSLTVQTRVSAPSVAVIEIPPIEEFFERVDESPPGSGNFVAKTGVLPRTLIHVFYEDSDDPDGVARLLFEGEFVSFQYTKGVERRTITLVARDISNILSSIYVRYYSDFISQYSNTIAAFTGTGTPASPDPLSIRMSLIGGPGLNPEILTAVTDDKNGFGIASAFRQIVLDGLKTNVFFNAFNDRTKVKDKIVALVDIKSKLLLEAKLFEGLILQNMSNLKQSASVWDLYSMLMTLVFYFPVSIPSSPFIPKRITEVGDPSIPGGPKEYVVSKGNTLMSLLLKPITFWTSPPNFNVIFPSQYKTFTVTRDFLSEPTRLLITAFGIVETLLTQPPAFTPSQFVFIAPKPLADRFDKDAFDSLQTGKTIAGTEDKLRELNAERADLEKLSLDQNISSGDQKSTLDQIAKKDKEIADTRDALNKLVLEQKRRSIIKKASEPQTGKPPQVDLRKWNRSVMTADDGVSLASREDLKGIVFSFDYLGQTQVEVTKAKNISPNALRDYLSNVANYKLVLSQYKSRFAAMTLHFSPQIVCGFPALVIDPNRNIFGEVESVTHIIDANGRADTQIQLSFVRNDEVEFAEKDRNTIGGIQFPRWINTSYLPENIDQAVYKKLFPENRPDRGKPGIPAAKAITPAYGKNQVLAAREIRKMFFAARDRERFADSFTRRNIATINQVMTTVLGAPQVGRNFIIGGTQTDRFKAAFEYASKVPPVGVIARSENTEQVKA